MTIDNEKPLALFDMDGTLCDFDGAMRRDMISIASPEEAALISAPGVSPWHGDQVAPHLKARKKMIQDQPGWWRSLELLNLGADLFQMADLIGYRRMILTKGPSRRNPNAWTEKVQWVRDRLGHIPVTITEDKGTVYGRVLVDDWPDYIESWLAHRPRGHVLMPSQPWNEDFRHEQVTRCTQQNLDEAAAVFERMKTL